MGSKHKIQRRLGIRHRKGEVKDILNEYVELRLMIGELINSTNFTSSARKAGKLLAKIDRKDK